MFNRAVVCLTFWLSLASFAQDHTSYLPHFTQTPGKWNTVLNLTNPDSVEAQVRVHAWGVDGQDLGEISLTLGPSKGLSSSVAELFPDLPVDKGWLTLNASSENVKGVMMFSDISTGGESGLPLIAETGGDIALPLLENGAQRVSGFVVVNLAEEPTELTLTFTSPDASYKNTVTQNLDGRSKLVAMLPTLFGDDIPDKGRLTIHGTTELVGFALTFKNETQQIVAVPGEAWDAGLLPDVQAKVDNFSQSHPGAGMSMGLKSAEIPAYVGSAGPADVLGVAMSPNSIADIGSITKTFTATLIMLLKEEGLLTLDDHLDQWITGIPNGQQITLRQLMNHTSGIFNYTDSPAFISDWVGGIESHNVVVRTPQELVNYALNESPAFQPGTQWGYSNTNFILLGMIIEKATGNAYVHELRTRLLDPLGLKNTWLAGDEPIPHRARRYHYYDDGRGLVDVTDDSHMSWAWAAGAMASTPEDLLKWGDALFGGHILTTASLNEMLTPAMSGGPGADYGLGVSFVTVRQKRGYGHGGSTEAGVAYLAWFPEKQTSVALVINQRGSGLDYSPLIFDGLRTVGLFRGKAGAAVTGLIHDLL